MRYIAFMACSLAFCMLFAAFRLRRAGKRPAAALTAFPLCALSGFVFAKLFYVIPMAPGEFAQYGIRALTLINAEHFSFFGGCFGVCVGFVLSCRINCIGRNEALDVFAVPGTLLVAFARAAEYFLTDRFLRHGQIGFGVDIDPEAWYCFFPLAVNDSWDMPYLAVFALEAAAALTVFCAAFFSERGQTVHDEHAGRFLWCIFLLMDIQIFLESLHSQSVRWGFVRLDQLECAVGLVMLTVFWCVLRGRSSDRRGLLPVWLVLIMITVDVGVEFALDKLPDIPVAVDYGVMIATLVVIGITGYRLRRQISHA